MIFFLTFDGSNLKFERVLLSYLVLCTKDNMFIIMDLEDNTMAIRVCVNFKILVLYTSDQCISKN